MHFLAQRARPHSLRLARISQYGRRKLKPALSALDGLAAIPTAALEPPHIAASPAVAAFVISNLCLLNALFTS